MASVTYAAASCIYSGAHKPAVDALDLEVADGELMVMVGPSGSGKSTALRMLAGLEPVTSGEVRIGGQDVTVTQPRDRDVAMVFQSYALYPHLNVADNIAFPLKQRRVLADERRRLVVEAARTLGIEDLLERRPSQLSGGQRQRVAMGRAIVRTPKVFLMDEPLSNLDAKLRVQTRAEIATLQGQLGITTLYVTHDQVEAMTLGHRVAVLNHGQLQQVDTPRRLYQCPGNMFVAGFFGTPPMNLLEVPLQAGGAVLGDARLPLSPGQTSRLGQSGLTKVVVGVRPEAVRLGNGAGPEVRGRVTVVEDLGSEAIVYLKVPNPGGELTLAARVEIARAPRTSQEVGIAFDPASLHAFDPGSGERLEAS